MLFVQAESVIDSHVPQHLGRASMRCHKMLVHKRWWVCGTGYFMAGQSETGAKVSNSKSPPEGTLWLVYKREALMPLSQYPHAQQSTGGRLFGTNEEAALRSRCRMLR